MTESIHSRVRKALSAPPVAEFSADPSACRAHGCPCQGTIDLGSSGRFYCAWHARADGDKWPEITESLHAHRWLIDFIGDIAAAYNRGRLRDWVKDADEFWRDDPEGKPTEDERARFNWYAWRMREELSWRVGACKDRPKARVFVPMTRARAASVIESARAGLDVPSERITEALVASGDLVPPGFDDVPWEEDAQPLHHARAHSEARA